MFLFSWQSIFRLSDVGMNTLLAFFATFLLTIANLLQLESLRGFVKGLPISVSAAKRLLGTYSDNFEKWVCCPSCSSLYKMDDCSTNGRLLSKKCLHIKYPNHPQAARRKECGTILMKTVKTSAGTTSKKKVSATRISREM